MYRRFMGMHEDAEEARRKSYDDAFVAERVVYEQQARADAAYIAELQAQVGDLNDQLVECMDEKNSLLGEQHSTQTGENDEAS